MESEPPIAETQGTRTRRSPVPVAARHHLVLVPGHPSHRANLDTATLVPDQDDTQLPRRPRRTPQRAVVPTNWTMYRSEPDHTKITEALLDTLAYAA